MQCSVSGQGIIQLVFNYSFYKTHIDYKAERIDDNLTNLNK